MKMKAIVFLAVVYHATICFATGGGVLRGSFNNCDYVNDQMGDGCQNPEDGVQGTYEIKWSHRRPSPDSSRFESMNMYVDSIVLTVNGNTCSIQTPFQIEETYRGYERRYFLGCQQKGATKPEVYLSFYYEVEIRWYDIESPENPRCDRKPSEEPYIGVQVHSNQWRPLLPEKGNIVDDYGYRKHRVYYY